MARAKSSFPVPLAPSIKTLLLLFESTEAPRIAASFHALTNNIRKRIAALEFFLQLFNG
jgi:hypothetical protein